MERFSFSDAEKFGMHAQLVTLDNLLEKAPEFDAWHKRLSESYEEELAFWSTGHVAKYDKFPKQSLLATVKQAGGEGKSTTSKADLVSEMIRIEWQKTETFQAYGKVRKANSRLQDWADNLRSLPERLQNVLDEANAFHRTWIANSSEGLYRAAMEVRSHGVLLQEALWASQEAHRGLKKIAAGTPLADVVHELFNAIQVAVMGIIPSNLSSSGMGLEHIGALGGAKRLTTVLRGIPPRQAEPFISTVYGMR